MAKTTLKAWGVIRTDTNTVDTWEGNARIFFTKEEPTIPKRKVTRLINGKEKTTIEYPTKVRQVTITF